MPDCIFCKIAEGAIPSSKVYEDEDVLAFRDIAPQAPVHIIFIPKKHIMSSLNDITPENADMIGKIMLAVRRVAVSEGLENGYRVINNCGTDAGQTIAHLHFHLLGGKNMGEKII